MASLGPTCVSALFHVDILVAHPCSIHGFFNPTPRHTPLFNTDPDSPVAFFLYSSSSIVARRRDLQPILFQPHHGQFLPDVPRRGVQLGHWMAIQPGLSSLPLPTAARRMHCGGTLRQNHAERAGRNQGRSPGKRRTARGLSAPKHRTDRRPTACPVVGPMRADPGGVSAQSAAAPPRVGQFGHARQLRVVRRGVLVGESGGSVLPQTSRIVLHRGGSAGNVARGVEAGKEHDDDDDDHHHRCCAVAVPLLCRCCAFHCYFTVTLLSLGLSLGLSPVTLLSLYCQLRPFVAPTLTDAFFHTTFEHTTFFHTPQQQALVDQDRASFAKILTAECVAALTMYAAAQSGT